MKVAIAHDWLNQKVGGGENVLFELAKLYPQADIYTLIYNPNKFDKFLKGRSIYTSRLQKFPEFIKARPSLLLPFIKRSIQKWNFDSYDLVISNSSAWVTNITPPANGKHCCYCFSPARMLWDSWPKYLDNYKLGPVRRFFITKLVSNLRLWDYYQAQNGTNFIAISNYVADRITKFYRQPSKVIYPPVDTSMFKTQAVSKKGYYLIVSVLAKYKNIELAIKAFGQNGQNLIIAGDGPDSHRLKALATGFDNIEFLGRVDDARRQKLLQHAKGFVFCSKEDFGITMVEAIAAGTAVIALRGGGAKEIIKEAATGVFFDKPTPASMNRAIVEFESKFKGNYKLKNDYIFTTFDASIFAKKLREVVDAK